MDETTRQVINQEPVQGQIVANYGTINIQFGDTPEGNRQSSTSKHFWYVPYPRNPLFTGRDLVLRQLHERLTASKNIALTQPQAINGLGGIGKTQIAVEYAYSYNKEYNIVLCIRADTQDTIRTDFSIIADILHLPESKEQDQQIIVNAIKMWLLNQSNWLLILDNADDLDLIRDFIPSGKNSAGHILLTTRSRATSKIASNILVEKMALEEGALLLLRCAAILTYDAAIEDAKESDRTKAESIVEILDGLPLALDQAGAYIEETGSSLTGYLDLYKQQRLILLNERGRFGKDHPESVVSTFSLAVQKVQEVDPVALEILQFCAFLHPDEIPEEIFTDYRPIPDVDHDLQPLCADQFEFNSCVKSLLRFSLIQRNADTKTLTIHRLVQAVIKDTMNQSSQKVWAERTVKYISGSFPFAEPKTWQICQRYLSHAYICMELVKQWNLDFMEAAGLLYRTGKYLFQRAIYGEAEIYYLKSFEISENKYGSEYPGLASILENLAQLYDRQGRFSLAEEYYQQALELNKKVFSSESLNVAANLNDLAGLYRDQGNYIKAESYYHKALRLRKKQGLKSPKILNDLALLYKAQGKHTKAEPYYKETITSKSSEENINLASSLSNLADLYRDQRRFAEAEPLSLRALKISEEIQGPEHPDVATKANNLAVIYLEQNRLEEAEVLLLRVIAINKKAFESEHPATATALNNLAQIYLRQKKYPEAQKALKQAISIYEMLVGPVHPNIATSFGNLALCYALQQKNEEAEALYKHTLTTWELTSGKEPLKIIYTLRNYAFLLRDTKRKFEAVSLDNQAKEMEANMMKDNRENIKKQRNSSENTKAKPKRRKSIK